MNEAFFVYLSTFIFLVLLWKFGVFEKIISFLEGKRNEIRLRLSEANQMRKDAEVLYDEYRVKMEMLEHEASDIIASAQKASNMLLEKAQHDIEIMSERKKQEVNRRISDYERSLKEELVRKYADTLINILEECADKDISVRKIDLNEVRSLL